MDLLLEPSHDSKQRPDSDGAMARKCDSCAPKGDLENDFDAFDTEEIVHHTFHFLK